MKPGIWLAAAARTVFFLVSPSLLPAQAAWADDVCDKKLVRVATLVMTDADSSGRQTIPISFEGVQKTFLLDTGGIFPQLSQTVAEQLKLKQLDSPMEFYGANGAVSRKYAVVHDVAIGSLHTPRLDMQIATFGPEGLFPPTAFAAYDFDMDFAGHTLSIFSNDHCEGKVIYWPAKAVAVVPITMRDFHITVPVTIDGHNLTAIVDTGASTSTVRLDIAKRVFGLTPDSPDMKIVNHFAGDETALIYAYPFKSLAFSGIQVNNPKIQILPDLVNKNADHSAQTGSNAKRVSDDLKLPEVIIGMDVLRQLHVYLANKEKRLYLTEASAPAAK